MSLLWLGILPRATLENTRYLRWAGLRAFGCMDLMLVDDSNMQSCRIDDSTLIIKNCYGLARSTSFSQDVSAEDTQQCLTSD